MCTGRASNFAYRKQLASHVFHVLYTAIYRVSFLYTQVFASIRKKTPSSVVPEAFPYRSLAKRVNSINRRTYLYTECLELQIKENESYDYSIHAARDAEFWRILKIFWRILKIFWRIDHFLIYLYFLISTKFLFKFNMQHSKEFCC